MAGGAQLKAGSVIGQRYRIESLLGEGGLGVVYLCRNVRREAPVAIKLLRSPVWGEEKNALRSEFSILSRLRHPNLVRILDFGRLEDFTSPYIVREYVEGPNLFDATEGWQVEQVIEAFARLCEVVQYLHDRGVIHRDLKPSNVLISSGRVKVLDFGLAQWISVEKQQAAGGTLAYMAPEILMGRGAGPLSDFYSLGVLLYHVLARRLPFEEEDPGYLIQKHLQGQVDLRPITRLKYGAQLAGAIARLLEKNPEKRPSSADQIVSALGAVCPLDSDYRSDQSSQLYFSSARFVGRENEMGRLIEIARRVRETGRGWTVFVVGESGSGKSRCMEEFRIRALLEGWRVVQGSCASSERRLYGPYREILEMTTPVSPEAEQRKPETSLAVSRIAVSRTVPTLSHRLLEESDAFQFRNRLTREIVGGLTGKPTLVLLHDFHWADETTAAIPDYMTSDILAHPIFLCASTLQPESERERC
jgi:predicted Ser/Thr protein kinase